MTRPNDPPVALAPRPASGLILRPAPGQVGTLHEQLRRARTPRPRKPSPELAMAVLLRRVHALEEAVRRGGRR